VKNSYAMFTIVVYFYEQSRTIPPKIMTHRRESRCKSKALHAACNKFRSAAAVARANATAGPGTQIRTHSRSRRVHPLSLFLFLSLSLCVSQLLPLEREQVSYRDSIENIEIRPYCKTLFYTW